MASSVTARIQFEDDKANALVRDLRELAHFDREEFHKQAAATQVTRIRKRTQRDQLDVNEHPFRVLATNTVRSARPKPVKGQKKLPDTVRGPGHILEDGGQMLQAMASEGTDAQGRVFFNSPDAEQRAVWHNAGTQPYNIFPKNAKVLRIPTVGGALQQPKRRSKRLSGAKVTGDVGKGIFAKGVRHPGIPQRKFFGFAERDIAEIVKIAERLNEVKLRRMRAQA